MVATIGADIFLPVNYCLTELFRKELESGIVGRGSKWAHRPLNIRHFGSSDRRAVLY